MTLVVNGEMVTSATSNREPVRIKRFGNKNVDEKAKAEAEEKARLKAQKKAENDEKARLKAPKKAESTANSAVKKAKPCDS